MCLRSDTWMSFVGQTWSLQKLEEYQIISSSIISKKTGKITDNNLQPMGGQLFFAAIVFFKAVFEPTLTKKLDKMWSDILHEQHAK